MPTDLTNRLGATMDNGGQAASLPFFGALMAALETPLRKEDATSTRVWTTERVLEWFDKFPSQQKLDCASEKILEATKRYGDAPISSFEEAATSRALLEAQCEMLDLLGGPTYLLSIARALLSDPCDFVPPLHFLEMMNAQTFTMIEVTENVRKLIMNCGKVEDVVATLTARAKNSHASTSSHSSCSTATVSFSAPASTQVRGDDQDTAPSKPLEDRGQDALFQQNWSEALLTSWEGFCPKKVVVEDLMKTASTSVDAYNTGPRSFSHDAAQRALKDKLLILEALYAPAPVLAFFTLLLTPEGTPCNILLKALKISHKLVKKLTNVSNRTTRLLGVMKLFKNTAAHDLAYRLRSVLEVD